MSDAANKPINKLASKSVGETVGACSHLSPLLSPTLILFTLRCVKPGRVTG